MRLRPLTSEHIRSIDVIVPKKGCNDVSHVVIAYLCRHYAGCSRASYRHYSIERRTSWHCFHWLVIAEDDVEHRLPYPYYSPHSVVICWLCSIRNPLKNVLQGVSMLKVICLYSPKTVVIYFVVSLKRATRLNSTWSKSLSVAPRPSVVMRSAAILYFFTRIAFTASARFSESFWLNAFEPSGEA